MRYCARKRKADEEKWGIIGMIPDLDYEQFPDQHCIKTEAILKKNVWPEEHIRAVVSHGWGIGTDVEPQSEMGKGVEMLGVQVSDLIIDTISGMQDVAEQIVGF